MEKQMMFMLKCLVERKNMEETGDGSVSPPPERHGRKWRKKRDRNLSLKCAARTGIEPMILP